MKKNQKIKMAIFAIQSLGWLLFIAGIILGLYMYFSTFMPMNPWRKIFYILAFALCSFGIYMVSEAGKAKQILNFKMEGRV